VTTGSLASGSIDDSLWPSGRAARVGSAGAAERFEQRSRAFEQAPIALGKLGEGGRQPCDATRTPRLEQRLAGARGVETLAPRVLGVGLATHEPVPFEPGDEARDGGRTDLLGGSELARGAGPAEDEHREGREARSGEAGGGVLGAKAAEQVDGGCVEPLGERFGGRILGWAGGLTVGHLASYYLARLTNILADEGQIDKMDAKEKAMNATAAAGVGIQGLGQLGVAVQDLPAMTAFYRDRLGIPFLFEAPRMSFFDLGGVRLMLSLPEKGVEDAHGSILYLKVGDIAASHATLVERGIAFKSVPHVVHRAPTHELWLADFADPEGNLLVLMSEVPTQAG
jgi:catechol 2,3-dioxygenase-like lactoylglutathione lyase family enzyme